MNVSRGGTWSDLIGPILDINGAAVTDGVSAGTLTISAIYDTNGVDQKSGATLSALGNGAYKIEKPIAVDAALGTWLPIVVWNNGSEPARTYAGSFTVTAAGSGFTRKVDGPTHIARAADINELQVAIEALQAGSV